MVRPKVAPMARNNNNNKIEPTAQSTTQASTAQSKQQQQQQVSTQQQKQTVRNTTNTTNTKSCTTEEGEGEGEEIDTTEDTTADTSNDSKKGNQRNTKSKPSAANLNTPDLSISNKRKRTNSDNSSKNNKVVTGRLRGSTRSSANKVVVEPVVTVTKARATTKRTGAKKNNNVDVEQKLESLNAESYQNILDDFAVRQDQEETDDEDDDADVSYKASKTTKSKRQPIKRKQQGTDDDIKKSHVANGSTNNKKSKVAVVAPALPVISGRPKREAGLRASAMIIQTNEIEKTKYQYHYSNSNPALSSLAPPAPQQSASQPSKNTEHKQLKTSHSFSSFQIPQFSSKVYATLTNASSTQAQQKQQSRSTKKQQNPVVASKKTETEQLQNQLRQISTTTTLGGVSVPVVVGGDDDSSNDVLIIEAPSSHQQKTANGNHNAANAQKVNGTEKSYPVLTEDLMKEHHKTHDTGTGNGTFSQFTRDYIIKWILEYKHTEEKPYEPGEIPIESFGVKVLNDPQYLIVKSRQESAQAASSAILSRPTTSLSTFNKPASQPLNIRPKTEAVEAHKQPQHNSSNDNLINDCKKLLATSNRAVSAAINEASSKEHTAISGAVNNVANGANTNDNTNNNNNNGGGGNIASNINYFPTKCISASW